MKEAPNLGRKTTHMIKITVNTAVYEALHQAFPKASSAQRALNKYISVVESMINAALLRGLTPGGHPKCSTYGHPNCSTRPEVT